jgi:hypothetical protein
MVAHSHVTLRKTRAPLGSWAAPMLGVDPSATWRLGLGKKPNWLWQPNRHVALPIVIRILLLIIKMVLFIPQLIIFITKIILFFTVILLIIIKIKIFTPQIILFFIVILLIIVKIKR